MQSHVIPIHGMLVTLSREGTGELPQASHHFDAPLSFNLFKDRNPLLLLHFDTPTQ